MMEAKRMNCPACGNALIEIETRDLKVDVCQGGCGGVWFDWMELKRVDEPHEEIAEELLRVARDPQLRVEERGKRHCPRCEDQPMMRHYFSVKREVAVDECPACAGFWLDHGELEGIRGLFASEEEARTAARDLFGGLIDEAGADLRADSDQRQQRARRFSRLLRHLCPSYWIPGKQEWGAF